MKYFSYDPNSDGLQFHATEDEAKKAAEDILDYERDEASEGWGDYIDQICWGELKQRVVMTECRLRTDDDTFVSSYCDTVVDYGFIDA